MVRHLKAEVSKCPNDCECCEKISPAFVEVARKHFAFNDDDMQITANKLLVDRLITCCPERAIQLHLVMA